MTANCTASKTPATENREWGFWGTLADQGRTDAEVQAMWDHVVNELAEIHDAATTTIRDLLDSRIRRHIADEFGATRELPQWAAAEVRFFLRHGRARDFGERLDGTRRR